MHLHPKILVLQPDRRKRDIDNVCKQLLDALQISGIYKDDNQIVSLKIKRALSKDKNGKVIPLVEPGGRVNVKIEDVVV